MVGHATAISSTSPTMEQLFGSMDFCDCPECRSILSPAAYLVDLLNFVDYPPAGKKNPQTVLLERRPDLQYLPLTCENTNTSCRISIWSTRRSSTSSPTGCRLRISAGTQPMALSLRKNSSQARNLCRIRPTRYSRTRCFRCCCRSIGLLELLRLHFEAMGVPLHAAMAALHARNSGHRSAADYGWSDILMERVGLSRAEYRLLTDGSLTLKQIYGFMGSEAGPVAALPPAKPPSPSNRSGRHRPHKRRRGPFHRPPRPTRRRLRRTQIRRSRRLTFRPRRQTPIRRRAGLSSGQQ